jgi:hypothetical protein
MADDEYFTLNDRPVKIIKRTGGWDVMVLDMTTGDWECDESYFERYLRHDGDIDMLTEAEFDELVASIRKRLDT